MIKKTLYFGNPAYLSTRNNQLVIKIPEVEKNNSLPESFKRQNEVLFPIEDLGVIILDHKQITITHDLMGKLLDNNVAFISCDNKRMPTGLMLPLNGNTTQNERYTYQINATEPLKKNLWQQTIKAKIANQAAVLKKHRTCNTRNMVYWAESVKSGDPDNYEARAAAYYWKEIFHQFPNFTRKREGIPPNNLLNYGYAILRAVIARNLVASGLLPTLGIHHHNRYNAYCLADDIMEPYRPFVDELILSIVDNEQDFTELTKEIKSKILQIPTLDVVIGNKKSPLMIAVGQTTASLHQCYASKLRKIKYPRLS